MKTKMLILILTVLALSACGRKGARSGASRGQHRGGVTQVGTTTCSTSMYGAIYDNSTDAWTFTQRLVDFTGNADLGLVEPQYSARTTGVDMQMTARFSNNSFDAAGSRIMIRILDEKWAQGLGKIDDIVLTGDSGVNRGNGSFTASFKDQYGTVTVEGSRDYSINMVGGVIYFQNTGAERQVMGRFWISGCSLVGI